LDVDSRPGLVLFLNLLQNQGFEKFNLLRQNNSAKLVKQPETLETTSYITGYFSKGKAEPKPVFSLLALGQIENSTTAVSSLNRNRPNFSVKFLERLFYGQAITTAFVKNKDEKFENLLSRFSVNRSIYSKDEIMLGNQKIAFVENAEDARLQIDRGVTVVIGSGQKFGIEEYKQKIIIKGLGELLTSAGLKSGGQSLAAGFIYSGNELKIYLFPIRLKNGEGKLLVGKENDIVLSELAAKSKVSPELKKEIQKGIININPSTSHYGLKAGSGTGQVINN
jgi:hypothetical protein